MNLLARLARRNFALVVAGLITSVAIEQAILFANGNVETALGILGAVSPARIFTAAVVPLLPYALLLAGYLLWRWAVLRTGPRATLAMAGALYLVGTAALTTPLDRLWVAIAIIGAGALSRVIAWPDTAPMRTTRRFAITLLTLAVLFPVVAFIVPGWLGSGGPWSPPEALLTSRGTVVGYVLGSEGGWTTVLNESPRYLLEIQTSDIHIRRVCKLREPTWDEQSFLEMAAGIANPPPVERCPGFASFYTPPPIPTPSGYVEIAP